MQTEELLARTITNKAVNDKKRLATSNANFARSRTVTAGTCSFPSNVLGCDVVRSYGGGMALAGQQPWRRAGV